MSFKGSLSSRLLCTLSWISVVYKKFMTSLSKIHESAWQHFACVCSCSMCAFFWVCWLCAGANSAKYAHKLWVAIGSLLATSATVFFILAVLLRKQYATVIKLLKVYMLSIYCPAVILTVSAQLTEGGEDRLLIMERDARFQDQLCYKIVQTSLWHVLGYGIFDVMRDIQETRKREGSGQRFELAFLCARLPRGQSLSDLGHWWFLFCLCCCIVAWLSSGSGHPFTFTHLVSHLHLCFDLHSCAAWNLIYLRNSRND